MIRSITVGPDPKSGMRYKMGTIMMGDTHQVSNIIERNTLYEVYIQKIAESDSDDARIGEIMLWKEVLKTMPIVVERSINY